MALATTQNIVDAQAVLAAVRTLNIGPSATAGKSGDASITRAIDRVAKAIVNWTGELTA